MGNIPVKVGEKYFMDIEDIGDSGEGIGRVDGFTVFVEGGVPGDRAMVEIIKTKKSYAMGKIVDFIETSSFRTEVKCPMADECGGCQLQHISYEAQLELKKKKVQSAIERIGKLKGVLVHDVIGMDEPYRYRNKAQLPIGIIKGKSIIGFYKKRTHEIVNIKGCQIQHEINDKVIEIFKKLIDNKRISVYDERTGKGLLRHIMTKVSYSTGDLMVVIITNGNKLPYSDEIIKELTAKMPSIKSIVQNVNTRKTNVILGRECRTLYGQNTITDYIGDLKFEISPISFFQVNPFQTEKLYNKASEYAELTGNETVFDIYCGIGTISLFLARKSKKVYGIEVVKAAIEDAIRNAEINNIKNAEFFTGKAEEIVPKLYGEGLKAEVVVVDPPRKGCDKKVLETIANMNPQRIVYVSCKPSTLARDLNYLNELGYKTIEVQPVDMFPHTTHVETVVKLQRQNP